jgi:hypothetical protein
MIAKGGHSLVVAVYPLILWFKNNSRNTWTYSCYK